MPQDAKPGRSIAAVRFVIEALEHYQKYHDRRLEQEGLTEEEISDLANDRQYLEAIKQDFENYREALQQQPERVKSDA
jgi:hypothetical protein